MRIRNEAPGDAAAIAGVIQAAFASHPHSDGSEGAIVAALRETGLLTLSLVAEIDGAIIGHAAYSPVAITGESAGWFGLAPASVLPARQGQGIGSALVREGLARLRNAGAKGCVVLGEPEYYARFGFVHDPALTFPGPPPAYFQRIVFSGDAPAGIVRYAPAFGE